MQIWEASAPLVLCGADSTCSAEMEWCGFMAHSYRMEWCGFPVCVAWIGAYFLFAKSRCDLLSHVPYFAVSLLGLQLNLIKHYLTSVPKKVVTL